MRVELQWISSAVSSQHALQNIMYLSQRFTEGRLWKKNEQLNFKMSKVFSDKDRDNCSLLMLPFDFNCFYSP